MSLGLITRDGQLVMTFQAGNDLLTNVIISLEIAQGSFFVDPDFGLVRRARMKNIPATAQLIEADIRAALQWLLDAARATAIDVAMEIDTAIDRNRLKARVTVTGAKGDQITYDKFVEVV